MTSFGGGTESSKLYSGVVVVVVGARTVDVTVLGARTVVVGSLTVDDPPLHALKAATAATRTTLARFPTSATLGVPEQKVTMPSFAPKW